MTVPSSAAAMLIRMYCPRRQPHGQPRTPPRSSRWSRPTSSAAPARPMGATATKRGRTPRPPCPPRARKERGQAAESTGQRDGGVRSSRSTAGPDSPPRGTARAREAAAPRSARAGVDMVETRSRPWRQYRGCSARKPAQAGGVEAEALVGRQPADPPAVLLAEEEVAAPAVRDQAAEGRVRGSGNGMRIRGLPRQVDGRSRRVHRCSSPAASPRDPGPEDDEGRPIEGELQRTGTPVATISTADAASDGRHPAAARNPSPRSPGPPL